MKFLKHTLTLFSIVFLLASCGKENLTPKVEDTTDQNEFLTLAEMEHMLGEKELTLSDRAHFTKVYTLSNSSTDNQVIGFGLNAQGNLSEIGRYSTGGTGTDGGLGNQGAITSEGRFVYAVSAGSNELSVFYRMLDGSLKLKSTIDSEGEMPVSVTVRNGIVYVLNAGGTGNIAGFAYNHSAELVHISNSKADLSSPDAGAAQISFSQNGRALIVTEKKTNTITSYRMLLNRPWEMMTTPSANATPFGFSLGATNNIYVSEAAGGMPNASTVSTYKVKSDGSIDLVDGPVSTNGTAACWVVSTSRNIYTTNTGSNDVAKLKLGGFGQINDTAVNTAAMSGPIDAALDSESDYLYVLTGGNNAIIRYSVENITGNLTQVDMYSSNLPDNMTGLLVEQF